MKDFDLNACGVSEMDAAEMQAVNGGCLLSIFIGALMGAFILEMISHMK